MIKLEKILERKVSEIEELYNYDFTDETRLQKLKKERAEQKYTREVRYQMLENHLGSHPFDSVMNKFAKSGDKYVGEYKNGKMHGLGTFTFSDGRKNSGQWKNGEYVGK